MQNVCILARCTILIKPEKNLIEKLAKKRYNIPNENIRKGDADHENRPHGYVRA